MAFRITSSMTTSTFLGNLNRNKRRMDKLQEQLSSNKLINRPSDNPTGAIKAMGARSRLMRIDQYRSTLSTASTWLRQGETAVMDMNQLVVNVYEKTIDMTTDGKTAEDRKATSFYVEEMIQTLIETANSSIGDQFIFGGYNTTQKPFVEQWSVENPGYDSTSTADFTDATGKINPVHLKYIPANAGDAGAVKRLFYNGIALNDTDALEKLGENAQRFELNVGFGELSMDITKTGAYIMGAGPDNVYDVLRQLQGLLADPATTASDLGASITKLQQKQSHLLSIAAEYGGKANRVEMVDSRFAVDEISYNKRLSDVEDAEQAEVIMQLKMAEAVMAAALDAGARILQPTLLNYMR